MKGFRQYHCLDWKHQLQLLQCLIRHPCCPVSGHLPGAQPVHAYQALSLSGGMYRHAVHKLQAALTNMQRCMFVSEQPVRKPGTSTYGCVRMRDSHMKECYQHAGEEVNMSVATDFASVLCRCCLRSWKGGRKCSSATGHAVLSSRLRDRCMPRQASSNCLASGYLLLSQHAFACCNHCCRTWSLSAALALTACSLS